MCARRTRAFAVGLALALFTACVACAADDHGRHSAMRSCRNYESVNGMPSAEANAAHDRALSFANAAAKADRTWTTMASDFRVFLAWSRKPGGCRGTPGVIRRPVAMGCR